jgi:hypothetical protein
MEEIPPFDPHETARPGQEDQQDGAATGGYAAVSSPEFREA